MLKYGMGLIERWRTIVSAPSEGATEMVIGVRPIAALELKIAPSRNAAAGIACGMDEYAMRDLPICNRHNLPSEISLCDCLSWCRSIGRQNLCGVGE